ncbi:glutamate-rich protein 5 [Sceloporus undulatus]|uniref:glutamate-rich protein 5 n=1 Tax=Sceloporus undulatus TaxID=8520 RepID=UPI001C4B6D1D|nr:glutamate-rich protein 5 [Sceloporus undulatus]
MGCASSAHTQVRELSRPASKGPPEANGLQRSDDSLPITDENGTIPDQTKFEAMDEVKLGSPEIKQSESLAKEVADALIPGMTNCVLSTFQRVDPEGTEPQPVEEKFSRCGSLSASHLEAGEPRFLEPTEEDGEPPESVRETANILPPEIVEDNKPEPAESLQEDPPESTTVASVNLVTEIVKELEISEEELLTEDNNCVNADSEGETGEKMETEMHCEIVNEVSETKEEETGEATATATEIEVTNEE